MHYQNAFSLVNIMLQLRMWAPGRGGGLGNQPDPGNKPLKILMS